jgi:hypothetical protein
MANTLAVELQLNIENAKRQLNQLSQEAQKALKSGGAGSQSYQQASQAAAQQRVQYRDALAQQSAFNKAIAEEARLRQQAMQVADRTITSAIPGGNILGSGLGLGGTAALAGATAVAAAIGAVTSEFSKLGDRARELASTSSNASSQLGQLRSSIEKAGISRDINATSPSVVGFQKFITDVSTNIGDAISHALDSGPDRAKALQEKLAGGLGQGNEEWRRLKEQGVDMETDIGLAKTAMQVKYQRQERDFDLSQRKFQVDTASQIFDLQKQAGRQQFDQAIAVQKFQENFANQQSAKAYNLSRQFAAQSFAIQQGRTIQDYSISQGRARQDFSISQSDKTFDFKKSMADQSQDFAISQGRAMTGRKNQLFDMAMGGANGLQYLQAARDFNQQQQYAKQDYALNRAREARDFGIGMGRDTRNFGISQQRAGQDFGIAQQRAGQDFSQQAREAAASRQLELESQEYARRYEGLQLQTEINRQTQDLAISFQRLNQSIGFQKEGFANQKADMAYDKALDYSNFDLQTGRQRRNFGYAEADFAGAARAKDPLGAAGLGSRDATFAEALARNAQQSGQIDLFKQVNDAAFASNNSLGAKAGDAYRTVVDVAKNPFEAANQSGIDAYRKLQQQQQLLDASNSTIKTAAGMAPQQAQPITININAGNPTFPTVPGVSKADLDRINQQYQSDIAKATRDVVDEIKKLFGG